jgi:hypothetical protein
LIQPKVDDVAGFDRLVEKDDDARDKVGHDLLQAEAEADTDRAGENGKACEVNANRLEADEKSHAI